MRREMLLLAGWAISAVGAAAACDAYIEGPAFHRDAALHDDAWSGASEEGDGAASWVSKGAEAASAAERPEAVQSDSGETTVADGGVAEDSAGLATMASSTTVSPAANSD